MKGSGDKIACLNPNTGRKMNIDADIYSRFSKAIFRILKENKPGISFSDMVNGVKQCFKMENKSFKGSFGWYTVTVKHDMEAKGLIETYMKKGKKLHRLRTR